MGSAVSLWNVIGKTKNALVVTIVPLKRRFDRHVVFFTGNIKRCGMKRTFRTINVLNESKDTA